METNEKILQIRGKLGTDIGFELGEDIRVIVTVTGIEDQDNQDGKITKIYKAKLFEIENEK